MVTSGWCLRQWMSIAHDGCMVVKFPLIAAFAVPLTLCLEKNRICERWNTQNYELLLFFERSLELITCLVSLALSLCLCNQQNSLITGFSLFTPVNYSKAWLKLAKYLNFTPERQLRAEEDWRQGKLVSLNQLRSLIPRRWRLIALHVRHGLNLNND